MGAKVLKRGQHVLNPYLGVILEFRDGETGREALIYWYELCDNGIYSPTESVTLPTKPVGMPGGEWPLSWVPVSKIIDHWEVRDSFDSTPPATLF